jgi:hypothetical protein
LIAPRRLVPAEVRLAVRVDEITPRLAQTLIRLFEGRIGRLFLLSNSCDSSLADTHPNDQLLHATSVPWVQLAPTTKRTKRVVLRELSFVVCGEWQKT